VPQDESLLAAGYLHDVMEDCSVTYEELKREFNQDIADLVKEVTKSKYNTFPHLSTRRGVMLKFADRLANLSMMDDKDEQWQKRYIEKSKFWK
jgi:(p)ppGpp synthase/HD superfamily hydrolase